MSGKSGEGQTNKNIRKIQSPLDRFVQEYQHDKLDDKLDDKVEQKNTYENLTNNNFFLKHLRETGNHGIFSEIT